MYARPSHAGAAPLDFGVSGKLWRHTLVLYDRQTGTLWSQHSHRALAGPLAGSRLEVLASEITDWGSWRTRYPDSTALVVPRPPGPLAGLELRVALVIALGLAGIAAVRRRRVKARARISPP